MSSWVITWIAEAVSDSRSRRFETEVTSRFISCSILSFFKATAVRLESRGCVVESGCWANAVSAKQTRPNVKSIDVPALRSAARPTPSDSPVAGRWRALGCCTAGLIPEQVGLLARSGGDPHHAPPTAVNWLREIALRGHEIQWLAERGSAPIS